MISPGTSSDNGTSRLLPSLVTVASVEIFFLKSSTDRSARVLLEKVNTYTQEHNDDDDNCIDNFSKEDGERRCEEKDNNKRVFELACKLANDCQLFSRTTALGP